MTPIVIAHLDDDGFCGAYMARKALGDIQHIRGEYQRPLPKLPEGVPIYIIDLSYGAGQMDELNKLSHEQLALIDHHQSAKDRFGKEKWAHINLDHSGCELARQFFHLPENLLCSYVEDWDLWAFKLPYSKEINTYIQAFPKTFEEWDILESHINDHFDMCVERGGLLLKQQDVWLDWLAANVRYLSFAGYDKVPFVNAGVMQSQLADRFRKDNPLVVIWYQTATGMYKYSLRSVEGGANCQFIAEWWQGGGKPNTAGFTSRAAPDHLVSIDRQRMPKFIKLKGSVSNE